MTKHLLSIADIEQYDFLLLLERSTAFSLPHSTPPNSLAKRSIGIYFRKTSTRTRTSFVVATVRLGGFPLVYGPADLQTNTGESIEDTVRVLSGYLDALIVRTAGDPAELRAMRTVDRLPIINAMTADEHPTQAISDLSILIRKFGSLSGLRIMYAGEGNNTAASLALAASRIAGMEFVALTPKRYGLSSIVLRRVAELSKQFGGKVEEYHEASEVSAPFDVLYTTRWQTTGTEKSDPTWREQFARFRVSNSMMSAFGRTPGVTFMHDLPAVRGEDTDSEVLDGPCSIAFEQADQKLYAAMAILDWCIAR